uniref:Uncharacterized protein n=1 Tax=Arundo donax TaxID=35708 RepID=A0A0A9HPZ6_ARUDO
MVKQQVCCEIQTFEILNYRSDLRIGMVLPVQSIFHYIRNATLLNVFLQYVSSKF